MNARNGWWLGAVGLLLGGCVGDSSSTGTVRGRVVDANGQPVSAARIALDRFGGRSTVTNARGEFRLGGVRDGSHVVLAFAVAGNQAGASNVEVDDGSTEDVGDVVVIDCEDLANGVLLEPTPSPTPDGNGSGEPDPTSTSDPGDYDVDDMIIPCGWEPPPPPPEAVTIDSFDADWGSGWIDPSGFYGYLDDAGNQASLDVYVPGDFAEGSVITFDAGTVDAIGYGGLYTYDSYGYYYLMTGGELTIEVGDDGDGDPSTSAFSLHGENLQFVYYAWEGLDAGYTATVVEADGDGSAYRYVPPEPPSGDITIETFVADYTWISLCPGCGLDGEDTVSVYAYDVTDDADLSLWLPVTALAIPGSAVIEAQDDFSNGVYGSATVYGDAYWYYELDHATLSVLSDELVAGETFELKLSDGVFDYASAYGSIEVCDDAEGGAQEDPTAPPASDLQLFVGAADLTAVVDSLEWFEDGTTNGGGEVVVQ